MTAGPNPFLIPGARPGRPVPSGDPERPAAPSAPPVFLPAGPATPALDSGTRRVPRAGEPGSDPAPDGEAAPGEATTLRPDQLRSDPLTSPVPGVLWTLVLLDGVEIPLEAAVLLGREPVAPDGVRGARPIAVRDPGKTVSKTHALITPVEAGVRVRDLHSSNGTALVLPAGRTPVPADGEALVTQEAALELGRFRVRLRHREPVPPEKPRL